MGRLSLLTAGSRLFRRFAHCVGCGNELVFPVSRTKAFADPVGLSRSSEKLNELYAKLSDAQRAALDWNASEPGQNSGTAERHQAQISLKNRMAKKAINSNVCKHCVMAREGTVTSLAAPQPTTGFVGRIFHVVDATDFPLGLPENFSKGDMFVVNRCDLLVPHESLLPKLKKYFTDAAFRKMEVPDEHVVLTSAQRGWHLKKLSEAFVDKPKTNYFVGPTNAGKTTLVHTLCGVPQKNGPTTWPLPFATQRPLAYRSMDRFRSKALMDTPSSSQGAEAFAHVLPSVLRKVCAGTRMTGHDPKYALPRVSAKSGQVVSIGGMVALEFPALPARLPVHVFVGMGGVAHTQFAHAFSNMDKVADINNAADMNRLKHRMHDQPGLALERKLSFRPWQPETRSRQSLVVKGVGYLQPFLFGDFPPDYEVGVWAAPGLDVGVRPEVLSYLYSPPKKPSKSNLYINGQ